MEMLSADLDISVSGMDKNSLRVMAELLRIIIEAMRINISWMLRFYPENGLVSKVDNLHSTEKRHALFVSLCDENIPPAAARDRIQALGGNLDLTFRESHVLKGILRGDTDDKQSDLLQFNDLKSRETARKLHSFDTSDNLSLPSAHASTSPSYISIYGRTLALLSLRDTTTASVSVGNRSPERQHIANLVQILGKVIYSYEVAIEYQNVVAARNKEEEDELSVNLKRSRDRLLSLNDWARMDLPIWERPVLFESGFHLSSFESTRLYAHYSGTLRTMQLALGAFRWEISGFEEWKKNTMAEIFSDVDTASQEMNTDSRVQELIRSIKDEIARSARGGKGVSSSAGLSEEALREILARKYGELRNLWKSIAEKARNVPDVPVTKRWSGTVPLPYLAQHYLVRHYLDDVQCVFYHFFLQHYPKLLVSADVDCKEAFPIADLLIAIEVDTSPLWKDLSNHSRLEIQKLFLSVRAGAGWRSLKHLRNCDAHQTRFRSVGHIEFLLRSVELLLEQLAGHGRHLLVKSALLRDLLVRYESDYIAQMERRQAAFVSKNMRDDVGSMSLPDVSATKTKEKNSAGGAKLAIRLAHDIIEVAKMPLHKVKAKKKKKKKRKGEKLSASSRRRRHRAAAKLERTQSTTPE
ncbi:hypothetical protein EJ04DRAFT_556485 [Polyplosphaeria fusca]|uniref:Uncharacterized protein n=1 Tax=Polyplosphaeria fusca TaxID=682080 RepID=A0A9P4QK91_9PLEO|nr:hypothetical protein EJ04DRAFT_556485 [Polyplosphaeria fusca]